MLIVFISLQVFSQMYTGHSRQTDEGGIRTWSREIARSEEEETPERKTCRKETRYGCGGGDTGQEGDGEILHDDEQPKLGQDVGDDAGLADARPSDHRPRDLLENHLQSLEKRHITTGRQTFRIQFLAPLPCTVKQVHPMPFGPCGRLISESIALSQSPAKAARPRMDTGPVCRTACLFTPKLTPVPNYTA